MGWVRAICGPFSGIAKQKNFVREMMLELKERETLIWRNLRFTMGILYSKV
jgi:hypothetical protein